MSIVTVTDSATLNAALKAAVAGETIKLAAGNYGAISIADLKIVAVGPTGGAGYGGGPVSITSLDAAHPAVLTGLTVVNSSGLTFSNLQMSIAASTSYYPLMVNASSNISFSGLDIEGSQANTIATGMFIENSSNVSVTRSTFHNMFNGVIETGNTGVTISGNTFNGMTVDGVDNAQSTNVNISNNSFTNFAPLAGSHPDAIQFWTQGTTKASSNITISGNTISIGGGAASQGIFLTDQVGNLAYQNVNIASNTITGGLYNAIVVDNANKVTLSNNNVISSAQYTSWIAIDKATNVSLVGNSADAYIIPPSVSFTASGNRLAGVLQSDTMMSATTIHMTYAAPLSHTLILTGTARVSASANDLGDHIYANNAGDYLMGGAGHDTLVGGAGNDTITAGSGVETLTGGAGTNIFVFGANSTADTITDLAAGTHNTIDISAYLRAGVTPTLTDVGANAIIGLGAGHSITLLGVQAEGLIHTASGFGF